MDFCLKILGHSINDLSYDIIENYFSFEKEETDVIEFKSFVVYSDSKNKGDKNEKFTGILKGISAFLNSDGGIIIWGAPEGKSVEGRKEKIFVGALTNVSVPLEKDALINRISSNIIPVPNGINCKILEKNSNKICVIEIQQSQYPPHQTDKRYFMRLDGQSVDAPHHYIEALFKKITYPNLGGYLVVNSAKLLQFYDNTNKENIHYIEIPFTIYIINFSPLQNEELISWRFFSNYAIAREYFFRKYRTYNIPSVESDVFCKNGREFCIKNAANVLSYGDHYKFSDSFAIELNPLYQNNYEVEFKLQFGGKKSPQKESSYLLKISTPHIPISDSLNCNHLNSFNVIEENVSIYETTQKNGLSKDEELKKILGRTKL